MSIKIFFSYAHEDEALLNKLKAHLKPLQLEGLIDMWHDRDISAGTEWKHEIDEHLNSDQLILLLISPDFMNSDYCYSIEMERAMERHERGEARVIPVILRPVHWQVALLGRLQALPTDAKPVTGPSWHSLDEALFNVQEGIRKAVAELLSAVSLQRSFTKSRTIEFAFQQADITAFEADVVALKYAQEFYGTDETIAFALSQVGIALQTLQPVVGMYGYIATRKCIAAHHALFVGVPDLNDFGYQQIKEFAQKVLNILEIEAPHTQHLVMTIHGTGFGLDEIEAFLAQCKGYFEAIQDDKFPAALKCISIIDRNEGRVQRLRQAFEQNFASTNYVSSAAPNKAGQRWAYNLNIQMLKSALMQVLQPAWAVKGEKTSETKPYVFVAMPFKKEMEDIFYFGIQQPVRAAGFICERIDQEAFIGDILDQVKRKIETAALVIAELTGANPNVYLEVGYAWGKGRPTILLVKDEQDLHFDVRGQRCLKYENSIRKLEESLNKELLELKSKGFISSWNSTGSW